jgi:hypothetical protein
MRCGSDDRARRARPARATCRRAQRFRRGADRTQQTRTTGGSRQHSGRGPHHALGFGAGRLRSRRRRREHLHPKARRPPGGEGRRPPRRSLRTPPAQVRARERLARSLPATAGVRRPSRPQTRGRGPPSPSSPSTPSGAMRSEVRRRVWSRQVARVAPGPNRHSRSVVSGPPRGACRRGGLRREPHAIRGLRL